LSTHGFRSRSGLIVGIVMLIVSFIIYLYLGYFMVYGKAPDDLSTWFHKHVVSYLKAGGDPWNDRVLRYIDGRNLFSSPILFDYVVSMLGLDLGVWTIFMGFIYIIMVFLLTYKFFNNYMVSGLSSLILASTPCFIYWFKYNSYGSYILQPLWLLSILLLTNGFVKKKHFYILISIFLNIFLWLSWSEGWVTLLLYSIYLSALILKGGLEKIHIYLGLIILVSTMPLNMLLNLSFITIYHIYAYLSLLATTLLSLATYMLMRVGRIKGLSARFLSALSPYVVSIYLLILITSFIEPPGLPDDYVKTYNPLLDYGVVGLFTLLAVILIARARVLGDITNRFGEYASLIGFILGIVFAYMFHPFTVFAISSISPFIGYSLYIVSISLYRMGGGRIKYLYLVISLWIIVGSILSNAVPAYTVSSNPPAVNLLDLYRYPLTRKFEVNESSLIKLLELNRDVIKENSIIISYWEYSYWITGYLGSKASVLADYKGSIQGYKYISWIMASDEYTALGLIKNIVSNSTNRTIYVIVSEIVSVDLNSLEQGSKVADLGAVLLVPSTIPGERPKTSYQALGDLDHLVQYVYYGGFNASYYFDVARMRAYYELSLAWSDKAIDSLVVKLIYNALKNMGYGQIYNEVYRDSPLYIGSLQYFKFINATMVPLYRVQQDIYSYQIYYMSALYEVEL